MSPIGVRKSSLCNIASANYTQNQRRTYPNGSNMDNLVGIWNDVSFLGLPAVRVEDAFIKPLVDKGDRPYHQYGRHCRCYRCYHRYS